MQLPPRTAGILMAGIALALAYPLPTRAEDATKIQASTFDVPAGDLRDAIDRYSRATGTQLLYKLDDVKGKKTLGVHGASDADSALKQLLHGTGLEYRKDGAAVAVFLPTHDVAGGATPEEEPTTRHDTTSDASKAATLDTVTVSVQRRPEAAQTVPIALTNFSGETLEAQRITNLQDVSRLTPGLLVSSFSASNPTIAIRGANNTFSQMGVSKPVAVVVDDVFIPRNTAANFELFDLDSLTVLKGPQGTLFGRNVTGGAIVINTRKPEYQWLDTEGQVTLGNKNARQFDALTNIPIGDDQAVKLTVATRDRDGLGRDRLNGNEEDDVNSRNFRGQWRANLSDTVESLFSADYGQDSSGGRTLSSVSLGNDGNPRTSELGVPQNFHRTLWGASEKLDWRNPWGDITSITAYRHGTSEEAYSGVGVNYAFLTSGAQSLTHDAEHLGTATQEFRYASPLWDAGHFQTGVFLLDENGTRHLGLQSLAARTGSLTASSLANQDVSTRSASMFADATWNLASTLELAVGARYTYDRKIASLVRTDFLRPSATFSARDLKASWSELTPRAALNWKPTPEMMLYASVTQGFTSGGFNTDATSLNALTTKFNPETVVNHEIGIKSQWLDNRLRFNMSVFDMRYRDKQEFINNSLTGILSIVNASRATIRGTELEAAWRPVRWLGLTANYGYLHGRYDRFKIGNIDYTGNPLASSPTHKASLAADWTIPVRMGDVIGAVSYGWQSSYNTGAANDPNLKIPGYGLLNVNIGLASKDRQWKVVAWIKNATNRKYILTRSTQVVLAEYIGDPRTFGVTVGYRF